MRTDLETQLLHGILYMPIIDTHEHLPNEEYAETDVLAEYLTQYFSSDLVSAGLPRAALETVRTERMDVLKKWDIVEPYWRSCQHTGYGRSLSAAARILYDIQSIDRDSIEELNARFQAARKPGHYQHVLQEVCNIETSIVDMNLECDKRFFRSVLNIGDWLSPCYREQIVRLEQQTGLRVRSLGGYIDACLAALQAAIDKGIVAIKIAMAYGRTLAVGHERYAEAEAEFTDFVAGWTGTEWIDTPFRPSLALQDTILHRLLQEIEKCGLPVQIHTGMQEGNGNWLAHSDPLLLNPLFLHYPGIVFDLFHIGYPFEHTLGALCKMHPNVMIDMCWAHIISPEASVRALIEWVDAVPLNKISAFGGDYGFIDGVVGHEHIMRENIACALAEHVRRGTFGEEEALRIAKGLLYDNPKRIFRL